ncbi:MAG: 3-deoxy-8-phosphooctulonate synthase [Phycisphaerales bacterium]
MSRATCQVNDLVIGPSAPLCVIAGPCALESIDLCVEIGEAVGDACARHGLSFIFKASYDKANRSSVRSPRGPGIESGLEQLAAVRERLQGTPVTTDIHLPEQAAAAAEVADLLQIPAFLCRQTDLLAAAAETGRPVNVKKGQFLSPAEMKHVVGKLAEAGANGTMVTERGTFFGYHRLVNDFVGLGDLLELGPPVCFDVTHSTQLPGATSTSGGRPERAPLLARAAVAAGVDCVFLECHPNPSEALSDASNMLPLQQVPALIASLAAIRGAYDRGDK